MRLSKKLLSSVTIAAFAGVLFVAGCSKDPNDTPAPDLPKGLGSHVTPPKPHADENVEVARQASVSQPGHKISFQVVQSVFNARCMPCHSAQNLKGGINLSTYDAVMADKLKSGKKLIGGRSLKEGDSGILDEIYGAHPAMPKGQEPIATTDLTAISSWIHAGAPNN